MRVHSPATWLVALLCSGALAFVLVTATDSAAQAPPAGDPAPLDDPAPPKGVEIQTRGPVHEAFASPTDEAQPTTPVVKAPPKAIEEMPPEDKPEGDAVWIGGYWAWDEDRSNYLWVSGVWRTPPPKKHWVAGYWRQDDVKYQWVPGFWAETQETPEKHEVTYMPKPPDPPETAAPAAPPNPDSFYVPGQYVWRGDAYAWRAGYWARVQPGYVWVAAHFRWTPYGYIYIAGYWDLAIANRGVMYAPVVIDPDVVGVGFVYTPVFVVHHTIVMDAFFVRPCYCHYYFGDYYGPAYHDRGFETVIVYNRRHYDAVIVYERWDHRADPRWESVQIDICLGRGAGRIACPPRTFVEFNRWGRDRGIVVAPARRVAALHGTRMVRMEAGERARVVEHARAVREVAAERRATEAKLPVGAPRQPHAATVAMPKGYTAAHAPSAKPSGTNTPGARFGPTTTPGSTPGSTPGKPAPGKPQPGKPMPKVPPGKEPPKKDEHH